MRSLASLLPKAAVPVLCCASCSIGSPVLEPAQVVDSTSHEHQQPYTKKRAGGTPWVSLCLLIQFLDSKADWVEETRAEGTHRHAAVVREAGVLE